MQQAFAEGGWGMYPTLFFGILFLCSALAYARDAERRRLRLASILAAVTLGAGTLGFVTGVIATLKHSQGKPDQAAVIAEGIAESLHNIGLGLSMLILGGLVAAVGAVRGGHQKPQAATTPTAAAD